MALHRRGHVRTFSRPFLWQGANQRTQKGPMDVFIQTVRKEGALGLYKGKIYPICSACASHPSFF